MEYLGLAGFLLGVVALNKYGPLYSYQRCIEAMFLVLCTALPMIVFHVANTNVNVMPKADTAAESAAAAAAAAGAATATTEPLVFFQSLLTRSLGMVATVACVCFFYWLFDEYHASYMSGLFGIDDRERPPPHEPQRSQDSKPQFHNFFALGGLFKQYVGGGPFGLAACALAYLCISHYVLGQPRDGYYELGRAILNLSHSPMSSLFTSIACRQHLLECLVRPFYAPLMFTSLCDNLTLLHYKGFEDNSYMTFWRFANNLIFSVDLCFAFIGYAFPFSLLLGTHIRSVEPTLLGWLVALMCYQPFFQLLTDRYLDYPRNPPWNEWLTRLLSSSSGSSSSYARREAEAQKTFAFRLYGTTILFLQAIFSWCTISFGLSYSNLSYRGKILTTGPYYFCKHPAYVSKILSFALISVPWIDLKAEAGGDHHVVSSYKAFRNCFTLALLACIYVLRAKTEEAHLTAATTASGDYQSYSTSMSNKRWWVAISGLAGSAVTCVAGAFAPWPGKRENEDRGNGDEEEKEGEDKGRASKKRN